MPAINDLEEKFFPFVREPAQYIGGEINIIKKDWADADVRIALAFPDAYTIGSSSLAIGIIYDLLNRLPNVLCERVFCPLSDAADRMRRTGIPLFTLESHRPVKEFDIVAISVPYEMLYTNVLEMLDLAGITINAAHRGDDEPLVIVGGSQANNPEPIADFIDLALLGEAEAGLPRFLELFAEATGRARDRKAAIRELAEALPWVYAPSLYHVNYNDDGTIKTIQPENPALPMPVGKAYVKDLEETPAPVKPIVPYVHTVHERINIEIMRGCPHAWRFCGESHTRRPVRYRSPEKIVQLAEQTFANTGLTEISLCSLSSADYPQLGRLCAELNGVFAPQHVSVALPSLRAERQLELVPAQTSMVRKSPLTIAIESADPLVRKFINKPIDEQALFGAVKDAYRFGWQHVKLYFIVGLPAETFDNLPMIVEFADRLARLRCDLGKPPAQVTVSASFFVPKPHTPLQWLGQKEVRYFSEAKSLLRKSARSKRYIKLKFHNQDRSFLEAAFARGDRRLGRVIYSAWQAGATFDAWNEAFSYERYLRAFERAGLDPQFYANRDMRIDETLPWEHLRPGPDKSALARQMERALALIGRNEDL